VADEALLKAIIAGLEATGPGSDTQADAESVAAVLTDHGMILPPGITINAVYEVFRDGMRDGYEFTDRREAEHHARFGGCAGRCGEVRSAWRIRADGVDATTTWRANA
jgi:hypothetical protein